MDLTSILSLIMGLRDEKNVAKVILNQGNRRG